VSTPRRHLFFTIAITLGILFAVGCREQDKSNFTDAQLNLTLEQAAGRRVFRQYCAQCHQAYISNALHGPSLKGLYAKKEMASGAPPTDERVSEVVMRGRKMMPGFSDKLDQRQLDALLAYLHTL
jgi:mono/diheme cytochrome c family protein